MKDIKSIIRLNCNEEIDVKYFSKNESITDATLDYSELLEYINEIEDKNERLENIIKEVREYFKNHTLKYDDLMLIKPSDCLEILDKENNNANN